MAPGRQRPHRRERLQPRLRTALEPGPPLPVGEHVPCRATTTSPAATGTSTSTAGGEHDVRRPPAGAATERDFGVGYARRRTRADGIDAEEFNYAPFGDDPVLLHDVTITNTGEHAEAGLVVRVLGREPGAAGHKGADRDRAARLRRRPPHALGGAAARTTRTPTRCRSTPRRSRAPTAATPRARSTFFGAAVAAAPAAVAADRLEDVPPGASGTSLFAFRAPQTLAPGQSVTLRYAYGAAHAAAIPAIVDRYRAAADPLAASERRGRSWVPQATLGPGRPWIWRASSSGTRTCSARARPTRSAPGRHVISQGGYYQYDLGFQGAFRDPLQHMLPLIYADRPLARDVLIYSAAGAAERRAARSRTRSSRAASGSTSAAPTTSTCGSCGRRPSTGWPVATSASSTSQVRYSDGSSGTLWDHLKLAFQPPGVAARPARRLPHGRHRRLVRLRHPVPPDDRVDARLRPDRVHLPAAGRARGRARGQRVRGRAAQVGRARRGHRAARVDG